MFESVVTKLVKAVGSDSYLPSPSVLSSEELSPLSLVERKASRWYFGSNSYYTTEFNLSDVILKTDSPFKSELEPEKLVCGFTSSGILKINGKLSGHFKALFDAELDNVTSITVKADLGDLHQQEADLQSLLDNTKTRRLDMNHELVREMALKDRRALCVVVGVIKTTKATQITASLNFTADADAKAGFTKVAGAEAKGDVEANRSRTISLPAETVLAYEVRELSVDNEGAFHVMVSQNAKGGFSCSDIDQVDARPVFDSKKEHLKEQFSGMMEMVKDDRKSLIREVKSLCEDETQVEALALSLRTKPASHDNEHISHVMELVSKQSDSQSVTLAVLAFTRALRNLDAEMLCDISTLTDTEVHILFFLLDSCHDGAILPRSSEPVLQLWTSGLCTKLIFDDLMFNLDENGLASSKTNSIIANSAFMAFYVLDMMC